MQDEPIATPAPAVQTASVEQTGTIAAQSTVEQGAIPAPTPAPDPVVLLLTSLRADLLNSITQLVTSAKTEILWHVSELLFDLRDELAAKPAPGPTLVPPATTGPTRGSIPRVDRDPTSDELDVGDPVKVWTDAQHQTFRIGEISAVHDGRHAYDVTLDDGTRSKVPADGLEYDLRR